MNPCKIFMVLLLIVVLISQYILIRLQYYEYNKELNTKYARIINKIVPVVNKIHSGLILNTTGCKIPIIETSKLLLSQHFKQVQPTQCDNDRSPLFQSTYTSIFMVKSVLKDYDLSSKALVTCCYMWIKRMTYRIDARLPDFLSLYQNECVFFNSNLTSPYEFIKVQCFEMLEYLKGGVILYKRNPLAFYTDFFYFVKPLDISKKRSKKRSDGQKLNILIVGLDSVSRINFHRQMPKSLKMLKDLDAVEFFGYNKIGDNTFTNVIALLTGNSSQEIFSSCVEGRTFDKCKFIWDYYKDSGYATVFAEDALNTGLFTYTYGKSKDGFVKQPTDYYWNNFYREFDKTAGNKRIYGINYCFNSRKVHELLLEYLTRVVTVMEESKQSYFGYFWQSILFHNDINQARNGDDIYSELLNYLSKRGFLNNTILFFISDHGHRISTFRGTYEGMLEDRLPFLFVRLPDWMKNRYPHLQKNLIINSKRLVTMYDVFETLKQLLNTSNLSASINKNVGAKRGYSLLAPITDNRTCESAAIPVEFCTCQDNKIVSINDEVVLQIAKSMVSYINNKILHTSSVCVKLTLHSILYAKIFNTQELSNKADGYVHEDYTVAFRTAPSQSIFEATVRRKRDKSETDSLSLIGKIIRLNTYFNESLCVSDHFLKQYCFCTNLIT